MATPLIRALDVPPKMVLEIASGIKDPADIAEEYGLTPQQWDELRTFEPFVKQVDEKRRDLKLSGFSFRMKSAFIAEELLDSLYEKATEQGASFHTVLELAKFTSRAAGLETPPKAEVDNSPAFSITIHLGGGQSVQIGAEKARQPAQNDTQDVFTVEVDEDPLPSVPSHLRSAAIDLNLEVLDA